MRSELVTTLKRKATEVIASLAEQPGPLLITERGRPAAYLIGVDSFEALERRVAILEGIARGERAIEEGRIVSHAVARKRLKRWLS